jgi:hypothetical protein
MGNETATCLPPGPCSFSFTALPLVGSSHDYTAVRIPVSENHVGANISFTWTSPQFGFSARLCVGADVDDANMVLTGASCFKE